MSERFGHDSVEASGELSPEAIAECEAVKAEACAQRDELSQTVEAEAGAKAPETPEQRTERLEVFVGEHLGDICPKEYYSMATEVCKDFEDECRELFEPEYVLESTDAADIIPELETKLDSVSIATADKAIEAGFNSEAATVLKATTEARSIAAVAKPKSVVKSVDGGESKNSTALLDTEQIVLESTARLKLEEVRAEDSQGQAEVTAARTETFAMGQVQGRYLGLKAMGKGNQEILAELLADESIATTPTVKATLEKIQTKLAELSTVVPEGPESEAFDSILNNASLNLGAESASEQFSDILYQVEHSEVFSETTKISIRQKLGIQTSPRKVDTGGDANDVFAKGYGTETYIDADGKTQTRALKLEPGGDTVNFGKGHELGIDKQGNKFARVATEVGTFSVKLPDNIAGDLEMGNVIRSVQMRAAMHEVNMHDLFYPGRSSLELGGGYLDYHASDAVITNKLANLLIKDMTIAGNDLFTKEDLRMVPYYMQFHAQKGDAMIGDVNKEQMREDYEAQGLITDGGELDWPKFSALVMANRNSYGYGEQRFKQTVDSLEV